MKRPMKNKKLIFNALCMLTWAPDISAASGIVTNPAIKIPKDPMKDSIILSIYDICFLKITHS